MRLVSLRLALSLVAFATSACDCVNDDNFRQIPDAGHDDPDAGPPPPVFPLQEGDEIEYQIGGRIPDDIARCPNGTAPGDCERDIKITYTIAGTDLDADNNSWTVESDYTYEGTKDVIEANAIAELILSQAAPFNQVSVSTPLSSDEPAEFRTDAAVTREGFNELAFPFFQFESGEAAIFEEAGTEFCDSYAEIDPDASCDLSPGDHRMEVYYVDTAADGKLHQLRVEYHPMGFICDWHEGLANRGADPPRDANEFNGVNPDPVAFFLTPIKLRRDGHLYTCFCSTGVCKDSEDGSKCLDPTDPGAIVDCPN
jgi:hypothetical protein